MSKKSCVSLVCLSKTFVMCFLIPKDSPSKLGDFFSEKTTTRRDWNTSSSGTRCICFQRMPLGQNTTTAAAPLGFILHFFGMRKVSLDFSKERVMKKNRSTVQDAHHKKANHSCKKEYIYIYIYINDMLQSF